MVVGTRAEVGVEMWIPIRVGSDAGIEVAVDVGIETGATMGYHRWTSSDVGFGLNIFDSLVNSR